MAHEPRNMIVPSAVTEPDTAAVTQMRTAPRTEPNTTAASEPGAAPAAAPATEPVTGTGPVRRFRDPDYQPLCATLAQVRSSIDRLDDAIVALLAERAMYVKDAARFKRDAYQVSAPARQAEVFTKVRALANRHDRGFDKLPDVVEATYRTLVAAFIANEQHFFAQTEMIGDTQ